MTNAQHTPPLRVNVRGSGQFEVSNTHLPLVDFDAEYTNFSGYFGNYGPEIFAAAPEMFDALRSIAAGKSKAAATARAVLAKGGRL